MNSLALLILLIVGIWVWYSGAKTKEIAIDFVQLALRETGLQLLDGTIYIKKIWPARLPSGSVGVLRFYNFEYTSNGADRYRGIIVMAASQLEYLQFEKNGHTIITTGENLREKNNFSAAHEQESSVDTYRDHRHK